MSAAPAHSHPVLNNHPSPYPTDPLTTLQRLRGRAIRRRAEEQTLKGFLRTTDPKDNDYIQCFNERGDTVFIRRFLVPNFSHLVAYIQKQQAVATNAWNTSETQQTRSSSNARG